jgi:hypothetical protein
VQPHSHAPWIAILHQAFQREEATTSDDGGLNLAVSPPAFQTAVRFEDLAKQRAHRFLVSSG